MTKLKITSDNQTVEVGTTSNAYLALYLSKSSLSTSSPSTTPTAVKVWRRAGPRRLWNAGLPWTIAASSPRIPLQYQYNIVYAIMN